MRGLGRMLVVLALATILPVAAYAQASISGTVKDTSGAVLPGVTVEAASDVLIEKVRTAVTDSNGRFQIVELRPGAYVVTFGLAGFNSVRRSGVTLAGTGAVNLDAELRVGTLEETITVTAESPLVDVRSTTRQQVLDAEVIDALPSSRNYRELARLIPGTVGEGENVGGSEIQDVGGAVTVHGSRTTDQRVTLNGISTMTLQAGGGIGGQIPDVGSAGEVAVDTSSLGADLPTGGVRINFIPRDGGNQFKNSTFLTFSNTSLQGDNFTPALQSSGLAAPNKIKMNFDLNESFGGPFKRDKLWFWFSARVNGADTYAPIFHNKNAFDATKWTYEADPSRQAYESGRVSQNSLRVTWQASPRNKIAGTYKVDRWCQCPDNFSATRSPEAGRDRRFPRLRQEHLEWTSPVTNRLLMEAVGLHLFERWGNMHLRMKGGSLENETQEAAMLGMIPVQDQGLNNLNYRAGDDFNNTSVPNYAYRAAVSYITGTHAFKVGFNRTHGFLEQYNYTLSPIRYRFGAGPTGSGITSGVPNQVTISARPYLTVANMDNDLGLYVQDRWSMNRMTVNLALRYDYFATSFPEQTLGPTTFTPNRNVTFPAEDNLGYKDITYRSGVAYDLFGTGKTAVKVSVNKYLLGQTLNGLASNANPINRLQQTAARTWADSNRNFVVDCDLLNFAAQNLTAAGRDNCGAVGGAGVNFGAINTTNATFDPDVLRGWSKREYNYEVSASVQHEIVPRVSLDVGYFRRIWGNFRVTDNLAVGIADFDTFSVTAPRDSRLPDGGGYVLTGLRNIKAASFGRADQDFTTLSDSIVEGGQIEHGDYIDTNLNTRLSGLTLQFGTSTGRTTTDNCAIRAALPELSLTSPTERCRQVGRFQTQFKGYAVYTVPVVDVQLSGTFRSTPGNDLNATFTMDNNYLAANSTLGRQLSAGANANINVDLLEPNTKFNDRRNEIDLRFGKVLRMGRNRAVVSLDMFNATNTSAVLTRSSTFTLTNPNWPTPQSILNARLMKFSVQYDF